MIELIVKDRMNKSHWGELYADGSRIGLIWQPDCRVMAFNGKYILRDTTTRAIYIYVDQIRKENHDSTGKHISRS